LGHVELSRAELRRHVDRILMQPTGKGAACRYVASSVWNFLGSRPEMGQAPGLLDRGACMVAGLDLNQRPPATGRRRPAE
jgi:hypothetical protein